MSHNIAFVDTILMVHGVNEYDVLFMIPLCIWEVLFQRPWSVLRNLIRITFIYHKTNNHITECSDNL